MELPPDPVPPTRQPPPPPRPWRFWLAVAVVAAGVFGLALVQRRTGGTPAPAPSAAPLVRVGMGSVCSVRTDRREQLSVSFTLVNQSSMPVRLLDVRPNLPMSGLRWRSTLLSQGSCGPTGATTGQAQPVGSLPVGGSLLVTFEFAVPTDVCPQPYPVRVSFQIDAGATVTDSALAVLNDLGEARFDACPTTG